VHGLPQPQGPRRTGASTPLSRIAPLPPLHRASTAGQPHAAGTGAASILHQQQHRLQYQHQLLSPSRAQAAPNSADGSHGFRTPVTVTPSWGTPSLGFGPDGPQESVADAEPEYSAASPAFAGTDQHQQQYSSQRVHTDSVAAASIERASGPGCGQVYDSSSFKTPWARPKTLNQMQQQQYGDNSAAPQHRQPAPAADEHQELFTHGHRR
jgi:hypothetical protein